MWTTSRRVQAPPEVVWHLLVDHDSWPEWGPSIAGATLEDAAGLELGARGSVRTAAGVSLPFVITEFEPGSRWAWSVAGVAATTHAVEPVDGGCCVTFGVPWWAPAYLAVCALALRRIDRAATASR